MRQDACFSRSEPVCQLSQPCGLTRLSEPATDTFHIGAQQSQLTRQRSTVSGTLAPVAEEHLSGKCHSAAAAPFTERAIRTPPGADPEACRDQEVSHWWQRILKWGCQASHGRPLSRPRARPMARKAAPRDRAREQEALFPISWLSVSDGSRSPRSIELYLVALMPTRAATSC
jgi:hypothetical protein